MDDFCFVCSRPTNHVGEHDALYEAGMVDYEEGCQVVFTEKYDREEAERISQEEYLAYKEMIGLP